MSNGCGATPGVESPTVVMFSCQCCISAIDLAPSEQDAEVMSRRGSRVIGIVAILMLFAKSVSAAPGDTWEGIGAEGEITAIRLIHLNGNSFKVDYPSRGCSSALRPLKWNTVDGKLVGGEFAERVVVGRCSENSRVSFNLPTGQADGSWEIQNRFGIVSSGTLKVNHHGAGSTGATAAAGNSIADAFHNNPAAAIKSYSTWSNISLVVRSIAVRNGAVRLVDIQVPDSVKQASEELQNKPFSWDSFHDVAVAGNNVYAQRYEVSCVMSVERFGELSIQEGALLSIEGKLQDFSGKNIVFECR